MVLDVVVEVVLDVVVVAGEAVVVVVDGDTVSVVGIVTSVGAKSAEDDPHAAAKRLLSTTTQATVRIKERLAFGPGLAVDHGPRRGARRQQRRRCCPIAQSAATISAISSPASVGFWPTLTPASSSASIFAAAVPFPPDTMAPAWPIFLPGGAVTPAM